MGGPDAAFVRRHTIDVVLASGRRVRIRPVVPEDRQGLAEGVRRISLESRYRRFFSAMPELPDAALTYFTDRLRRPLRLGRGRPRPAGGAGIGVARYIRLRDDPQAAEVAVAVADDHHRQGIGTLLLETVALTAREHGIRRLVAWSSRTTRRDGPCSAPWAPRSGGTRRPGSCGRSCPSQTAPGHTRHEAVRRPPGGGAGPGVPDGGPAAGRRIVRG